jgi:imidazole glycerol phosphate synthase subunit HisF
VLLVASTIFIVVTLNGIFTGIRTASDLTLNGSDSLPISTTTIDRQQLTKAFATAFVRPYTAIELK